MVRPSAWASKLGLIRCLKQRRVTVAQDAICAIGLSRKQAWRHKRKTLPPESSLMLDLLPMGAPCMIDHHCATQSCHMRKGVTLDGMCICNIDTNAGCTDGMVCKEIATMEVPLCFEDEKQNGFLAPPIPTKESESPLLVATEEWESSQLRSHGTKLHFWRSLLFSLSALFALI